MELCKHKIISYLRKRWKYIFLVILRFLDLMDEKEKGKFGKPFRMNNFFYHADHIRY